MSNKRLSILSSLITLNVKEKILPTPTFEPNDAKDPFDLYLNTYQVSVELSKHYIFS